MTTTGAYGLRARTGRTDSILGPVHYALLCDGAGQALPGEVLQELRLVEEGGQMVAKLPAPAAGGAVPTVELSGAPGPRLRLPIAVVTRPGDTITVGPFEPMPPT